MNYTSVFECEYIHVSLFENHMFLLIVIGFQFRHPHYRPLHHFLRLQRGTAAVPSPAKGYGRSAVTRKNGGCSVRVGGSSFQGLLAVATH